MGSQRAGHNWVTFTFTNVKITRSFMPSIFFVKLWNNWKCSSRLQTLNCTFQCYLLMKYSLHYFLTWMYLDHLKYQRHQIYIQICAAQFITLKCWNKIDFLSCKKIKSFFCDLNILNWNFSLYNHNWACKNRCLWPAFMSFKSSQNKENNVVKFTHQLYRISQFLLHH